MLFADDMVILGKDKGDLQTSLDLLEMYCHKWGLQVNTDKTKIVVFFKERGVGGWWVGGGGGGGGGGEAGAGGC